jgi:cell division protein ZipA
LLAESLQHGKYNIFHRLHGDGSIVFSVASMVEPGAFDLEKMGETLYPGMTMFTQLPGPVPGMHALNELIACARRLQANLGGTLQDERGVPLTVHRIERMRQEVREFERPAGGRGAGAQSAHV